MPKHLTRLGRDIAGIPDVIRTAIRSTITGEAPWPLVMQGDIGTGKTCAALCLLDLAGGEYYTVPGLCSILIQSQQGRLEWSATGRGGTLWPEKFWAMVAASPLVVLDELGCRDKVTDAHYEAVKMMVDERSGKPFVVISNLTIEQVATVYDARVQSRLAAGTMIFVKGKDRRI